MTFTRKFQWLLWVSSILMVLFTSGCPLLDDMIPEGHAGAGGTRGLHEQAGSGAMGGSYAQTGVGGTNDSYAWTSENATGGSYAQGGAGATDGSHPRSLGSAGAAGVSSYGAAGQQDGGVWPDASTYNPGPPVQIMVNSGATAKISVSDGQWQLFYFEAEAGQVYSISSISGSVRGYVSTSPAVSASNYQFVTDAEEGDVAFVAPATQRYYIAVVAKGGGVTGSFQVADGGRLLTLGSTSLTLTAPSGEAYWFFRFPVTAGHSYLISVEGAIQPNTGLAVAPRPERMSNGQLAYSIWGLGGSLPFLDQEIPATSVAASNSGFYFFYVYVRGTMNLIITLEQGL